MASPMLEGRVDPYKKAHFSLNISSRIASSAGSTGEYSSVKYNHKPTQTTSSRNTTLTTPSPNHYNLKLEDKEGGKATDIFTFTGQKTVPRKAYVLLFDSTTQTATLEPLSATYTFNLSTTNNRDVSSAHPKIYPKKQKPHVQDTTAGADDLFAGGETDDENAAPAPDNPYDFRHFLNTSVGKAKEKRGDESEYQFASSPDYRAGAGSGSAVNTPKVPARKPAASAAPAKASAAHPPLKARKRKSPEVDPLVPRKAAVKKAPGQRPQGTPTVRLDRRASTHPKPEPAAQSSKPRKTAPKAAAPPASKIKSAEIVHSSDDSDADADADAEGELVSSPAHIHHSPPSKPAHRPAQNSLDDGASDDDEQYTGGGSGGLEIEIEVPDEPRRPPRSALASLGLGNALGLGSLRNLKSPSNGPISLASAANSVEGSPNPHTLTSRKNHNSRHVDDGVIDFGDDGNRRGGEDSGEDEDGAYEEEEVDDRDVEPMDIGPPAQQQSGGPARKISVSGLVEEDEEDPLFKEMMEGLAGGDSSEESEEE
ncbi:RNA polymerase II transcription elongation factor-domain-containing protein [Massariosphaeria phaeospora]|uniref:RNA polymerase II transcription elongation factor-domain-containing protein n=1 Tax=Massariosphaeria phaeospora TaxID=100035 RepID=A0A7C8MDF7_9PLEO|nr:RNA polymerase II transcription elongation factor-domain-containing protein [Massariosphaeria phaeospora]